MAGPDGASHDDNVQGSSPSVADVAVMTDGAAPEIKLERLDNTFEKYL